MSETCLYCGKPISTYPCKFCGYHLSIPDVCPYFQYGKCDISKKLCPDRSGYMNCKVMNKG